MSRPVSRAGVAVEQQAVDPGVAVHALYAESDCELPLRIEVEREHALAGEGERMRDIERRGLAHAALLVDDRDGSCRHGVSSNPVGARRFPALGILRAAFDAA